MSFRMSMSTSLMVWMMAGCDVSGGWTSQGEGAGEGDGKVYLGGVGRGGVD